MTPPLEPGPGTRGSRAPELHTSRFGTSELRTSELRVSLPRAGSPSGISSNRSARGRSRGGRSRSEILHGVSLTAPTGVGTGLVGESGSGKSTLLRTLLALETPDGGSVTFDGRPVRPGSLRSLRWFRREVQYVPQDPASSLDPRMTVEQLLREPLVCLGVPGPHGCLIDHALGRVDLPGAVRGKQPVELSGGQNQRVALARALVVGPRFLLADEPVSGLDAPLRAQVLHVLGALVEAREIGLLMVSHDLDAVAAVCSRIAVLDAGSIVEEGPAQEILDSPGHPATARLIGARLPASGLLR